MRKDIITLTDRALKQIEMLLKARNQPSYGVRIGLKTKGCSGLSYFFEYADTPQKGEEVIDKEGIKLLIEPKAVMYLLGSVMDYVETDLHSGFEFKNPNEKGRCGCGSSFHV